MALRATNTDESVRGGRLSSRRAERKLGGGPEGPPHERVFNGAELGVRSIAPVPVPSLPPNLDRRPAAFAFRFACRLPDVALRLAHGLLGFEPRLPAFAHSLDTGSPRFSTRFPRVIVPVAERHKWRHQENRQ